MTDPLTEAEALILDEARELTPPDSDYPIPWDRYVLSRLVAIIDRLSAAPVDDRERVVPEGWRVERVWAIDPENPNLWMNNPVLVAIDPEADEP